jgi:hypothetical protein
MPKRDLNKLDRMGLSRQLREAFDKQPDAAGILQGMRKLRAGRPHTRTILFSSPKNGGYFIACDGSLEPEMALSLELMQSVVRFRGQPIEVPGPYSKNLTPDFAVDFGDGFAVIDVKPKARLASPRVKERMSYIRKLLAEAHIPHYIFTEDDLCKKPFHQIRHQLKKGLGISVSIYQRNRLYQHLEQKTSTVGELRQYVIQLGYKPYVIESAAIQGFFQFSINTPWGNHTQIGVNNEHSRITTADWGTVHDICPTF